MCGTVAATELAVPAYWGAQGSYAMMPDGTLAVLNPSNGILDTSTETLEIVESAPAYRDIAARLRARDVKVYIYVPTGYFRHDCDIDGTCQSWERIVTQLHAYFALFPNLDGVFFDEAAGEDKVCADYDLEYGRLRGLVRRYSDTANIIFNPGYANPCTILASQSGEVVLSFEGKATDYLSAPDGIKEIAELARAQGVKSWHLIHSSAKRKTMMAALAQAKTFGVDYVYATEIGGDWQAGENTWGSPARHWSKQVKFLRGTP